MTQPDTLPPFSGDEPACVKCGHKGASTYYRAASPRGMRHDWNGRHEMCGPLPERLERQCLRCGFQWDEALATSAGGSDA